MKKIILSKYLTPLFETSDSGYWFGYYNYDTLNSDQTKILCNKTVNDAQMVLKGMNIDLGYFDIASKKWHCIGKSDSYNWQQGAMMQWLPTSDGSEKIIYNTSKNGHIVSCIHDIRTKEDDYLSWGIYGITPDGKKSITIDFERSYWCRAYHYQSVANQRCNVNILEDDGIFEINLENNTRRRIISIQDIIAIDPVMDMHKLKHWLEHVMISPSGKRFCFLHRFSKDRDKNYTTRLFVANIDGSNLQMIEGWRSSLWSHFGWDGDDAFVIYRYGNQNLSNLEVRRNHKTLSCINVRKLFRNWGRTLFHLIPFDYRRSIIRKLNGQQAYYQYFCVDNGKFVNKMNLNSTIFDIDGHPSFTNDGRYMITDSYPDSKKYQRLIIYDKQTNKHLLLAKYYAALHKKAGSCDLHPKLCKNNEFLAVDSAYDGFHHLLLYKINWKKIINDLK